jgi:hypothetical protein
MHVHGMHAYEGHAYERHAYERHVNERHPHERHAVRGTLSELKGLIFLRPVLMIPSPILLVVKSSMKDLLLYFSTASLSPEMLCLPWFARSGGHQKIPLSGTSGENRERGHLRAPMTARSALV